MNATKKEVNEMNDEKQYSNFLIQQFVNANEFDNKKKLPELANDFKIWLEVQKEYLKIYNQALKDLEVPYDNVYCAEIGKGSFDSVVLDETATTIITPYIKNDEDNKKNIILPFDVKIINGVVTLQKEEHPKIINGFNRYMTQNPYTKQHLNGWAHLHLNNQPITIGVYGKITDKDREQKLNLIKSVKEQLESNFLFLENEIYQDTYISILSTKPSDQEKSLQKHL